MNNSASRFLMLLGVLSLPCVCTSMASAGVINPYTEDVHTQQLWETDVTAPGEMTAETGAAGNFNLSAQTTHFSCISAQEKSSTSGAFIDMTLFTGIESGLPHENWEGESTQSPEEANITTEVFNFPVPEPGSLTVWIILGLCAGFLIRRRAKS